MWKELGGRGGKIDRRIICETRRKKLFGSKEREGNGMDQRGRWRFFPFSKVLECVNGRGKRYAEKELEERVESTGIMLYKGVRSKSKGKCKEDQEGVRGSN